MRRTVPTLATLLVLLLPLLLFPGPSSAGRPEPALDLAEPPIIDFGALPNWTQTNLRTFLVASSTPPGHEVLLNDAPVPAGLMDDAGNIAVPIPLVAGDNILKLTIQSAGEIQSTMTKTVYLNERFSTAAKRLLYVDVDHGDVEMVAGAPMISGTVVIDLDEDALLGFIKGKHVVGISPDGSEIYAHDNTVISTFTHRETRTLPFEQEILGNAFLVSPDGRTLYSRAQRLDVETNTLLDDLPMDISTGLEAWAGATKPATPAISVDGRIIYSLARKTMYTLDTQNSTFAPTGITLTYEFVGDLALAPDQTKLLLSNYDHAQGRLYVYDTGTWELLGQVLTLRDFSGQIVFSQDGTRALVGSAGNPSSAGYLSVIDLGTLTAVNQTPIHLADNLTASGTDQFFASSGDRLGVDVYQLEPTGTLSRTKSFFLGVNRYVFSMGNPKNDQIRKIVYKPRRCVLYLPIVFDAYIIPPDTSTERE